MIPASVFARGEDTSFSSRRIASVVRRGGKRACVRDRSSRAVASRRVRGHVQRHGEKTAMSQENFQESYVGSRVRYYDMYNDVYNAVVCRRFLVYNN